ncbi:MAG: hypothetical protein QF395_00380, partial [Arenicellales bacterium]|nr:hypothetical protein [Arenicellales bacterium]
TLMKNKIKIVDGTRAPVAATLAIAFMEKSEECIRRVARSKNRTYRSLVSALNDGMAMKDIIPPISTALVEARVIVRSCGSGGTGPPRRSTA